MIRDSCLDLSIIRLQSDAENLQPMTFHPECIFGQCITHIVF